jgi:Flp pilus assembly protein TadG
MTAPEPGPRHHRDGGLASIEFAILLPVFVLLTLLATYLGRLDIAQTRIDLAAHDAARAASLARTWQDAQTDGTAAANATLAAAGSPCTGGPAQITIDVNQWRTVPVGQPVTVTATIVCPIEISDLSLPLKLASHTIVDLKSTFSTPVDQYRSRS